jgi:hypothetical protein
VNRVRVHSMVSSPGEYCVQLYALIEWIAGNAAGAGRTRCHSEADAGSKQPVELRKAQCTCRHPPEKHCPMLEISLKLRALHDVAGDPALSLHGLLENKPGSATGL